ncbi:hypothetical protein PI87_24045 [Ralstonia sp. A12]|uniref:hypothetical protein n=1 Tax=Ralstonia sp. A12 TaxID=1217052 RepID=UPI0005747F0C|nr:hypothetical protein [Ralstonia sp. A12]KHK49833.1 hypothetical protein PI87_24045 [Ralstonia sp. A12]
MPSNDSDPTPLFDDDSDPTHALRIGTRRVWLAYDGYTEPDTLMVYVELGTRDALAVAPTLNLLLSLCLEVEGAARGNVVRHPHTREMIYRFRYTLDDDPEAAGLIDAIAALTIELDDGHDPSSY